MGTAKSRRPKKCATWGCKNPIPHGRRKYCSADCQIKAARKLTREWRKRRDKAHKVEAQHDIPAQVRRYRIKGGGEIYDYLQDDSLISNRNPKGSKYAEEVIRWVDTLWPGESAMDEMAPKHKILIVAPSNLGVWKPHHGWGGIEKVCFYMAKHLEQLDVDVRLLFSNDENEIFTAVQDQRPTILSLHKVEYVPQITDRVEQFRDDGMVVTYTSHVPQWTYSPSAPCVNISRFVDGFVCLNEPIKRWADRVGLPHPGVITNGVDHDLFTPGKKVQGYYLCVGRQEKRKRFSYAANYYAGAPGITLEFVGPPGDDTEDIEQAIRNHGADNIRLTPNLSEKDVAQKMALAEAVVHPSENEADCLVVKEAMAAGCRVITSPYCASCVDQVTTDWNSRDPDMGRRAREEVLNKYTWPVVAQQAKDYWFSLWQTVAREKGWLS